VTDLDEFFVVGAMFPVDDRGRELPAEVPPQCFIGEAIAVELQPPRKPYGLSTVRSPPRMA